jgi:hypothetical protein
MHPLSYYRPSELLYEQRLRWLQTYRGSQEVSRWADG